MNQDSGVDLESLKVDGGMVQNELLMQFQADLLGVPVIRPEGRRDHGARRRLRGGPGDRVLGEQEDLRENWQEDKRWEPKMDPASATSTTSTGRRPSRGPSTGSSTSSEHAPGGVARSGAPLRRARLTRHDHAADRGAGRSAAARTGAGVAWDAALRGYDVILVDRADLAEGTSGRFHGLLHSGGRYVVKDPIAADECVEENAIVRSVAVRRRSRTPAGCSSRRPTTTPPTATSSSPAAPRPGCRRRRSTSPRRCAASRG